MVHPEYKGSEKWAQWCQEGDHDPWIEHLQSQRTENDDMGLLLSVDTSRLEMGWVAESKEKFKDKEGSQKSLNWWPGGYSFDQQAFPLMCTPVFRPLSALMLRRGWRRKLSLRRATGWGKGEMSVGKFPFFVSTALKPYVFICYYLPLLRMTTSNGTSIHCCYHSNVNAKQFFMWDIKVLCNHSKREGLGPPNL